MPPMIPIQPPGDEFSMNQFDERRINKLVRDMSHAVVELQNVVTALVEKDDERRRSRRN